MPEIIYPSEWLKINENVQNGDTIQFLDAGTQDKDERWIFNVAVFRKGDLAEPEKKFGLNKTNFKAVSAVYGTNSDNWINKEMQVSSVKVRNPQLGSLVDSIALSAPAPKATDAPVAPAVEPTK